MFRTLLNLCRRPAIRFGLARDPSSQFRNSRFASFLAENNRQRFDLNGHETMMRGRRLMRHLLVASLTGGAAWVVVESAKALSVF